MKVLGRTLCPVSQLYPAPQAIGASWLMPPPITLTSASTVPTPFCHGPSCFSIMETLTIAWSHQIMLRDQGDFRITTKSILPSHRKAHDPSCTSDTSKCTPQSLMNKPFLLPHLENQNGTSRRFSNPHPNPDQKQLQRWILSSFI